METGTSGEQAARDWESRYLAGDTPWDKGSAHPALLDWLTNHRLTGRVLVPGCGSGHDVRALAADPEAVVLGVDIAPSARLRAEQFPRAGREAYVTADFLAGPVSGEAAFDALFEHTCFCAIAPGQRAAYALSAAQSVRPGGTFLAIFYRNPDHEGETGPPFGCSMAEVDSLFGDNFEMVEECLDLRTFPGRERREVLRLWRRK